MTPADRTLIDHLERHAAERPYKPFVTHYEGERFRVLSYRDLAIQARAWAGRLAAANLAAERRVVAVVLPHGLDIYPAVLGAIRAGLLPTVLAPPSPKQDPALHWAAHRALFARVRPAAAITPADPAPELAALAAEFDTRLVTRDSPMGEAPPAAAVGPCTRAAILQHSSGTTGQKKGVLLSHLQVCAHVDMLAQTLDLGGDDVVASWLPLYHDMGLVTGFLAPMVLGASVVTMDAFAWSADPASILRLIARHRATVSWTPNFGLAHLTRTRDPDAHHDLTSLKALIDCSEPCRPQTVSAFLHAFADSGLTAERMACCYGMAEVVFAATHTRPGAAPRVLHVDAERLERDALVLPVPQGAAASRALLSCGPPLPGVRVRIAGAGRHDAEAGEILVRSRTLFSGYHLEPELDAASMTEDGWHRSGDVGFLHDGEVYVCGRLKELIIVHGRNLYAGDIEALAGAVPGVKPGRAAAVGVVDPATGGEECVVMLEAEAGELTPEARAELVRAVRARVEGALDLHLRRVEVGPPGWLVKSTSGKMSRAQNLARLEAMDAERAAAAAAPPAPAAEAPGAAPGAAPDAAPGAAGAPRTPWWRRKLEQMVGPAPEPVILPGGWTPPSADAAPAPRPAPAPAPAPAAAAAPAPAPAAAPPLAPAAAAPAPPPAPARPVQAEPSAQDGAPPQEAAPAEPPPPSPRQAVALAVEQCFGRPAASVHDALGPGDVDGWDSLGHTILMLRLERISRRAVGERVAAARTVGAIAAALAACENLNARRAA